ncbi:hypothetical protein FB561_7381, partial [Kribbella amoyensis]
SSAFAIGLLIVAAVGPFVLRSDARMLVLRAGALVCASGAVLLAVAPSLVIALLGGLLIGLGGALMLLVVPLMLNGPDAASRIARANAISSSLSIFAPLIIGAVDAFAPTGRLALLLTPPPLILLTFLCGRVSTVGVAGADADRTVYATPAPDGSVSASPAPSRQRRMRTPAGTAFTRWSRVVLAVSVEFCFVIWAVARLVDAGLPAPTAAVLGSAFPLGMAVGRLIGPVQLGRWPAVAPGVAVAAVGTVIVCASDSAALVTVGLALAGLGVATLYPITVADLIGTPGVRPAQLASLSAFASGTAILVAPAVLAALAGVVDLRTAFLFALPLLAVLLVIRVHHPASAATGERCGQAS